MTHYIATRFSVPKTDYSGHAGMHKQATWLERRFELFFRYYVPSVSLAGIPAKILCSAETVRTVEKELSSLSWCEVIEQNDWYAGWSAGENDTVTRLDSDDAIRLKYFDEIDMDGCEACGSSNSYLLEHDSLRLFRLQHRDGIPGSCLTMAKGKNPFEVSHGHAARAYRFLFLAKPLVVQVVHGGNIANRIFRSDNSGLFLNSNQSHITEVDVSILEEFGL